MRSVSTRTLLVVGLLVTVLLAGVVSIYASRSPDGLNRVAQDHGISRTTQSHRSAHGPLAGYDVPGVGQPRMARGLAGVAGVAVVLVVAGGGALLLRRRSPHAVSDAASDAPSNAASDAPSDAPSDGT
ncbi:MAG: cobalt/nickel transport protein [Nocardioidaceae bacterium]|nr:cobalt/nickel transport protein [Nocardioidaceae bacterium]